MSRIRQLIRKVPKRTVLRLFLIELAAIGAYLIAGFVAYYAQFYRSLPLSKLISFQAAQMLFVFGAQTIILMFVFYRWSGKVLNQAPQIPITLTEILKQPEHQNVEFKSSLRWDFKEGKVNKMMEKQIMKTVASFLNSDGGYLVIGVDDQKNIVGLAKDMATLRKPDLDSFENHFNNIFHSMIGADLRQFVNLTYSRAGDSHCCIVSVTPSSNPAYLKHDDDEEFYVRTGNSTTSLKLSEAQRYIKNRFS